MNELEKYTDEQLKEELKRRFNKVKAERANIARCRSCANIITEEISGLSFTKCKVNTYKLYGKDKCKVVKPSSRACEKYEKQN